MEKRKILFGDYDTAANGWTLAALQVSPPEQKTYYVDKPGGNGSWDLSTVLTDGVPVYNDRTLTARLELSTGDRDHRENVIREMVRQLSGQTVNIKTPDRTDYILTGRLQVAKDYSDLAHAAVNVTAVCSPWWYAAKERATEIPVNRTTLGSYGVDIGGGKPTTPTLTVSQNPNNTSMTEITIEMSGITATLGEGTHVVPGFVFRPGTFNFKAKGVGKLKITWREAVLE
jgi:hypothetical protein